MIKLYLLENNKYAHKKLKEIMRNCRFLKMFLDKNVKILLVCVMIQSFNFYKINTALIFFSSIKY